MLGLGSKLLNRAKDLDVAQQVSRLQAVQVALIGAVHRHLCLGIQVSGSYPFGNAEHGSVTSSGVGPEDLTFWKEKERRRYTKRKDKSVSRSSQEQQC